ncbi:DUF2235 domain-containing protein [Mycobacterium sp. OTB74]|uniref:DUF2235 domain-containing protein n=1 Tax=Mycobacterium sp. OTB74 TaxID=1853452 RepID=UPI00247492AF|nr:DUF2235 domain-containing protein [Mycobacterium sp. OTB74]MDH6242643.1 uncharacterized protein (DUF2235 family) [Mycobacterium sp. OTB74]
MSQPRNLVVCLDGTNNEPAHGATNVARIYGSARQDDRQLVYYDPGVGTVGGLDTVTPHLDAVKQVWGLATGYGIRENIAQAYGWLADNYRRDDRIFVFGFSRGAYTARALTGMLRTVGLLHPDSANMVPYALKLFAQSGPLGSADADPDGPPDPSAAEAERQFWRQRADFRIQFTNPDFPHPFDTTRNQVHFLGVWDTVKTVAWLDFWGKLTVARWPFTAKVSNVGTARHAMAIDERRHFFEVNRFDPALVATDPQRFQEVWFTGVHSDVGGQFPDHRLSDLAFSWIAAEAHTAGLAINTRRYQRLVGTAFGQPLPPDDCLGALHPNTWPWWLLGGWRPRRIQPGDNVHCSVRQRITETANKPDPYHPTLPANVSWVTDAVMQSPAADASPRAKDAVPTAQPVP